MVLFKNLNFLDSFFLGEIDYKEVFYAVVDRKQAILDYKNIHLRKSKT